MPCGGTRNGPVGSTTAIVIAQRQTSTQLANPAVVVIKGAAARAFGWLPARGDPDYGLAGQAGGVWAERGHRFGQWVLGGDVGGDAAVA